ncbi:glutamate racemase [Agitococcus lubricus]|uniref:Glutamate racemase n=1 Tax=Agitococcus lubricus TaxID=1077255 RepID=A0A2T5IZJ3_9GAMM|nr:glutamate racemase [Agitococcus lubricus]PTQ89422.1 glutamate racemase [Agitococcus lubricus]
MSSAPIGVFDSGYGGLTVLKELVAQLPDYDYLYLGDNARAPYGTRSYDTVYQFTLECVQYLFAQGCQLVILACNTASAKALRTIQQQDLPRIDAQRRVLGVIRPSVEAVGALSQHRAVGVLGTTGTVNSQSYVIEIQKLFPDIHVYQQACPMWVPLVENGQYDSRGADYFVEENIQHLLAQNADIDTVILGCTHYPLLIHKIKQFLPEGVNVVSQGQIVAPSLADYLKRHPQMEQNCSKNGKLHFLTTDDAAIFEQHAAIFFGQSVQARKVHVPSVSVFHTSQD